MNILKKLILYFLIPSILFFLAFGISLYSIFTYQTGFTVLPIVHSKDDSLLPSQGKLLKGQTVKGSFTADENNLGSVVLRIHNKNKAETLNEDKVLFRIKEHGAKNWYQQHTYLGTQFHELALFPFGFPLIKDSKGKTYDFEISSLRGNLKNALTIDTKHPQLVSEYQLSRHELLTHKELIFTLFKSKLYYALLNPRFGFSFLVYFLPLIVYLLLLPELDKISYVVFSSNYFSILHKVKIIDKSTRKIGIPLANIMILLVIFIDIFIIDSINTITLYIVFLLWIATIVRYKIALNTSFILALVFLILCPLFLLVHQDFMAQRAAVWTYMFLLLAVLQALLELAKMPKKQLRKN